MDGDHGFLIPYGAQEVVEQVTAEEGRITGDDDVVACGRSFQGRSESGKGSCSGYLIRHDRIAVRTVICVIGRDEDMIAQGLHELQRIADQWLPAEKYLSFVAAHSRTFSAGQDDTCERAVGDPVAHGVPICGKHKTKIPNKKIIETKSYTGPV